MVFRNWDQQNLRVITQVNCDQIKGPPLFEHEILKCLNCTVLIQKKTYQEAISNHRCRTQPSGCQLSSPDEVHCNVENIFHWALFYDRMDKSVVKNFFSEKSKKVIQSEKLLFFVSFSFSIKNISKNIKAKICFR